MNINLNFVTRFSFALLCVTGSLWLTTQLSQNAALETSVNSFQFDIWHGLVLFASFVISVIMGHYLARS